MTVGPRGKESLCSAPHPGCDILAPSALRAAGRPCGRFATELRDTVARLHWVDAGGVARATARRRYCGEAKRAGWPAPGA